MSILIKGLVIPRNEPLLIKLNPDGSVSTTAKNGYRKYAAITVPPHGDLIDRDFVMKRAWDMETFADAVKYAPAIIETEED